MAFGEEAVSVQRVGGASGNGYDAARSTRKDYTGYEKDEETGLEYAQARYYNPTHGRFTSVDPLTASATIRNPQTLNRYSYALNSPYKFTDPLGLLSEYTTGACGNRCLNSDGGSGGGFVGSSFGMGANWVESVSNPPESHSNAANDTPATANVTHESIHASPPVAPNPGEPAGLKVVKIEAIKLDEGGGSCTANERPFGYKAIITYQVVDSEGKPVEKAGMKAQERLSNATVDRGNGDEKVTTNASDWRDIGADSRNPRGTSVTDAHGIFVDAPFGACDSVAFTHKLTQEIRIVSDGKATVVRSQTFTISSKLDGPNKIVSTLDNGKDIRRKFIVERKESK